MHGTIRRGAAGLTLATLVAGCGPSPAAAAAITAAVAQDARTPVTVERLETAVLSRIEDADFLPTTVVEMLERIDARAIAAWQKDPETARHLKPRPQLLRCNVPLRSGAHRGKTSLVQLYVARAPAPNTQPRVLFLHDPESGATTPEPVRFEARWLEDGGTQPAVADLDLDGRHELVYRDVSRNGTMEHREILVFLRIGDDLSLTEVFRYAPWTRDILSEHEAGALRRRIVRPGAAPDRLVIESWRENPARHSHVEALKDVVVQRERDEPNWHLLDELPWRGRR